MLFVIRLIGTQGVESRLRFRNFLMPSFPFLDPFAINLPQSLWMPLAAVAAVLLDKLIGELPRWHPLVGFGRLADAVERALNRDGARRLRGVLAWALIVLPFVVLVGLGKPPGISGWLLDVLLLYFALGAQSLIEHAQQVANDLAANDLDAARRHVGWIVSRDTRELDEAGVAKACVESTLENGNDAVFGALFWFALLGGAGALLYRLANTLDAMWGYRNERFERFGWAAARIDDGLGIVPARLTALSYSLFGNTGCALACWIRQAPLWESPNAGPVMSAGAGSLGLALGGAAIYHGQLEERPVLGEGRPPRADDIPRAIALTRRSLALWLALLIAGGLILA